MATPLYNHYDELNKDVLLQDEDFLNEAADFLIDRGGYEPEDIVESQDIYDGFMEHFRAQNVNEITATRDLFYAQRADDESKERMGRLMDTFDKMDSDLGLKAAGDYLEGVFTAPSTYAGMFSFGSAKAGALAAQQGVKLGIRQVLKQAGKSAGYSAAIDAPFAAATTFAQEQARVDTGVKEEVDMTNVALATGLSTVASGSVGALTGAKRIKTEFEAEQILNAATKKEKVQIENAHKAFTSKTLKSTAASKYSAKSTVGKDAKKIADKTFLAMSETVPEKLKEGKKLRKQLLGEGRFEASIDKKVVENIAAAASRIINAVPPKGKIRPKGKIAEERISSRIARGLAEGHLVSGGEATKKGQANIAKILREHNVTTSQLSALFAEELSEAGSKLGAVGRVSKAEKARLLKELTETDKMLMSLGDITSGMRSKLNKEMSGIQPVQATGRIIMDLNKARIGMMTVQLATTARNVTNGYMRNFVYGLDNFGAGLTNIAIGAGKKVAGLTNKELAESGTLAINLGKAQLRTGIQSAYFKDMWLGTTSTETRALELLFRDPRFAKNKLAQELFRDMGDIAEAADAESGILWVARKANILNTMSDNMFKRAVFSREIDKYLRASGQEGGLDGFFRQNYTGPNAGKNAVGKFSQIDDKAIAVAMEEALAFTYQIGKFKGKSGAFNSVAQGIIDAATTGPTGLLISQGIPFPRYLFNQFLFIYEHAPILGMFDLGTGILRKGGDTLPTVAERFGKQVGGLSTLSAFYALRVQFGNENTGPYQYIDPTSNKPIDATANLGPFMAFAMMADILYRLTGPNRKDLPFDTKLPQLHDNDKVAVDIPYNQREIVQAFTGGQARAGVGLDLLDGMVENTVNFDAGSISQQTWTENSVKLAGNFLNTYTVGAGMLKDIAGTFMGPEFRVVQDNTDVNMMEYLFKQAARSIPQGYEPEEGDRPLGRTTRSEPVYNVNPFLKLTVGIVEEDRKTILEEELDRLKFDFVELSPRKIALDAPLSNEARLLMGKYMEREVASYINTPDYKTLATDTIKKWMLKDKVAHFRTKARNRVLNVEDNLTDAERNRRFKANFNAIGADNQKLTRDVYKNLYGGDDLLKELKTNDDLYSMAMGIYEAHVKRKPY